MYAFIHLQIVVDWYLVRLLLYVPSRMALVCSLVAYKNAEMWIWHVLSYQHIKCNISVSIVVPVKISLPLWWWGVSDGSPLNCPPDQPAPSP